MDDFSLRVSVVVSYDKTNPACMHAAGEEKSMPPHAMESETRVSCCMCMVLARREGEEQECRGYSVKISAVGF